MITATQHRDADTQAIRRTLPAPEHIAKTLCAGFGLEWAKLPEVMRQIFWHSATKCIGAVSGELAHRPGLLLATDKAKKGHNGK